MSIKCLFLMNWIIIFILACCLHVSAAGYAQSAISLSEKKAPLEKVLKKIGRQSGYDIWCAKPLLEHTAPVDISIRNATIQQALDACLKGRKLTFVIVGKQVTIIAMEQAATDSLPDTVTVSGKIVNEKEEPLPGATIIVRGISRSVLSNTGGGFILGGIPSRAVLVISHVGYETKLIPAEKADGTIIRLAMSVSKLDQVQVIGYGITTKRLGTGSVSSVSAEEIEKQPVANPLAAMQGRMAGLFINTINGLPGGNFSVQIRGQHSIAGGTIPLYIVDGVPVNASPLTAALLLNNTSLGDISPLSSINPADIESISVLKDADATAIYGSRGANGVILITTKKGKAGQTNAEINLSSGLTEVAVSPKLLSLPQYLAIRHEAFSNDGLNPSPVPGTGSYAPDLTVWDTTKSTDWYSWMLGGHAPVTNLQASISGGSGQTNFLISGNYLGQGTIFPGSFTYRKGGAYFTIAHASANNKFGVNLSGSTEYEHNNQLSFPVNNMLTLPPDFPLYDSTGQYNWTGTTINPAALLKRKEIYNTFNTVINSVIRYSPVKGLNIRAGAGYTRSSLNLNNTFPYSSQNPALGSAVSYAVFANNTSSSFILEPQADYTQKTGPGFMNILIGGTYLETTLSGQSVQGSNYSNENLLTSLASAGAITSWNDTYSNYKYASVFGRLNYDIGQKYIVNATLRRDGSSRFGPGNQYGNFGSLGVAWLFSNESFLKNNAPVISFGKLRINYGLTGNDQIADYQYLASYSAGVSYQGNPTLRPLRISNAAYRWETDKKFSVGTDLGFIQDRLLLTINYYDDRSSNQLVAYPLPYISGPFGSYQGNLPALVGNSGWEFELNTVNVKTAEFSWKTGFNISIPQNRLLKFPDLASTAYAKTYVVGQDLSTKKGFYFDGIDPATGHRLYRTAKGGDTTTPSSATDRSFILGKTSPYYYGGLSNTITWKTFQLDIFFQFAKQFVTGSTPNPGPMQNTFATALGRWKKPGDITLVPRATTYNDPYVTASNALLANATYLRLKNVAISCQLPGKWLQGAKIKNLRIYLHGQNLLTCMKKGASIYDPETGISGIPAMRSYVAGVQLSL
jgi:TonB-dependent starch-binding outer membrane protein SusC